MLPCGESWSEMNFISFEKFLRAKTSVFEELNQKYNYLKLY